MLVDVMPESSLGLVHNFKNASYYQIQRKNYLILVSMISLQQTCAWMSNRLYKNKKFLTH